LEDFLKKYLEGKIMGFTTNCFIRKNTPELRSKLEELGYEPNAYESFWADKTMIDNAIKWIKENIDLVAMDTVNARSGYHQIVMMDDFERKFRETMEK
jgi:hypothetical protein